MNYWVWALLFFIVGVVGFYYYESKQGNYDFGMITKSWISLILGLVISLTIIIVKQF